MATISHGDRIAVAGELRLPDGARGGYRSASGEPEIGRPRGGRLLVSSEPLEARFVRQARFHAAWSAVALVALLVVHIALFGEAYALFAAGDVVHAAVERSWEEARAGVRREKVEGRRGKVSVRADRIFHFVRAVYVAPDGRAHVLEDEVGQRLSEGQKVPFVVLRARPRIHMAGTAPRLGQGRAALGVAVALAIPALFALHARRRRPWYERKKIVHAGGGRLDPHTKKLGLRGG